jgi:hypothetical protein
VVPSPNEPAPLPPQAQTPPVVVVAFRWVRRCLRMPIVGLRKHHQRQSRDADHFATQERGRAQPFSFAKHGAMLWCCRSSNCCWQVEGRLAGTSRAWIGRTGRSDPPPETTRRRRCSALEQPARIYGHGALCTGGLAEGRRRRGGSRRWPPGPVRQPARPPARQGMTPGAPLAGAAAVVSPGATTAGWMPGMVPLYRAGAPSHI